MKTHFLLTWLLLGGLVTTAVGQSYFDALFNEADQAHQVILKMDLDHLLTNLEEEPYQEVQLSWYHAPGDTVQEIAQIKARGNTRKIICSVPPIKLKFKKDQLEERGFTRDFNDFKVVWQCKDPDGFSQYLYREYLVYRLYHLLTPNSFRAQLVHFQVQDRNDPDRQFFRPGFILENEEELAYRCAGTFREEQVKSGHQLDDRQFFRFCLFQYMIANTDWAMGNVHNLKYIEKAGGEKIIPIPYDFDYSGLVHAPYAVPTEGLPIQSVTQRYYKGQQPAEDVFAQEVAWFQAKMPEMQALCENFPYLTKRHRREMIKMLDSFARLLDKPEKLYRRLR